MSKSLNFPGARIYLCRVPFNKFDVDSADSKLEFVFFPYAGISLFPGHSNASVQATGVEHEWAFQGALTLVHLQLRCSKMSLLDKRSIKRIVLV